MYLLIPASQSKRTLSPNSHHKLQMSTMAMASSLLHSLPLNRTATATTAIHSPLPLRRRCLSLFLLSSPAISALSFASSSKAEDIGLFGIRKKLQKVEEEAVEIVKEGEQAVEKEIQAAEQGIEAVAEEEIASGGLIQAAAVAGAEAVGVLIGTSVVNGILGPEGKKT